MQKPNRFCMQFFSALANPLRIAILQSLAKKEKTVSELVDELQEERTLVSHNLASLLKVNLVSFKKAGKERIYYANQQIVVPLFYLIKNVVCAKCSFRRTCKVLQNRKIPGQITPIYREICAGCCK